MLKDDPPSVSPVGWTHIVRMFLDRLECIKVEPVLRFCIALLAVHMNRFISLIGVEVEPPPEDHQYRWHIAAVLLWGTLPPVRVRCHGRSRHRSLAELVIRLNLPLEWQMPKYDADSVKYT